MVEPSMVRAMALLEAVVEKKTANPLAGSQILVTIV